MARPKAAAKSSVNKKIVEAAEAGMDAQKAGKGESDCPYTETDAELREAWIGGLNGQRDKAERLKGFLPGDGESSTATETTEAESPKPAAVAPGAGEITPSTTAAIPPEPKHQFGDPDVKAAEEELRTVLRQLDDLGVVMAEEEFRQFTDDDRTAIRRWIDSRAKGLKSPPPSMVVKFIKNKKLLDSYAEYQEEQLEGRRKIFPAQFGKPSPTKPEGEPDQQIRMTIKVPVLAVTPIEAHLIWHWKAVKIEFGNRSINGWEQREFAECPQTTACKADISGYKCTRTHWIVSFLVDHAILSSVEANRLWGQNGSCRMEPVGEPESDKRAETENPDNEAKDETTKAPAPTLFDAVSKTARNVFGDDKKFITPDEFYVPSHVKGFTAIIAVGLGPNGRFYPALNLQWSDKDEDFEDDEGSPVYEGDGYVSLQEALISRVGRAIEIADEEKAPAKVLTNLKDELKRLEDGGAPHQIVDDDSGE